MSGVKSGEAWFVEALATLLERRDLGADAMRQLTERFVSGECGEVEMASLLVALRMLLRAHSSDDALRDQILWLT